jgi:hypothetical protein
MLSGQLPLGLLTDLAAYALPLDAEVKQLLLAECSVRERTEILLDAVEGMAAAAPKKSARKYPPTFSDN